MSDFVRIVGLFFVVSPRFLRGECPPGQQRTQMICGINCSHPGIVVISSSVSFPLRQFLFGSRRLLFCLEMDDRTGTRATSGLSSHYKSTGGHCRNLSLHINLFARIEILFSVWFMHSFKVTSNQIKSTKNNFLAAKSMAFITFDFSVCWFHLRSRVLLFPPCHRPYIFSLFSLSLPGSCSSLQAGSNLGKF